MTPGAGYARNNVTKRIMNLRIAIKIIRRANGIGNRKEHCWPGGMVMRAMARAGKAVRRHKTPLYRLCRLWYETARI